MNMYYVIANMNDICYISTGHMYVYVEIYIELYDLDRRQCDNIVALQ